MVFMKKISVVLAILVAFVGIACAATTGTITAPKDNAIVSMNESVTGTVKGIPAGYTMFLVVLSNTTYYPQGYPINMSKDGSWSSRAYFGGENDSGMMFDLMAVVADAKATKELNTYITTANKNKSYPGIKALPKGVTEFARVKVKRA
jgi:hypothetical protein